MDLREIFMTCNRDHFLNMYGAIKSMSQYTTFLNLPTATSSELFEIICDNIVFMDKYMDDDEDQTDEDYYNFET